MNRELLHSFSQKIEQEFLERLANMGLSFGNNISPVYLAGQRRFLGLWHGPMIAEIAGITRQQLVVDLGIASLFGRAYVIAQDQALDHGRSDLAAIVPRLLDEFLMRIRALAGSKIEARISEIIEGNTTANEKDLVMRQSPCRASMKDLRNIGQKTSVALLPSLAAAMKAKLMATSGLYVDITYRYLLAIQIADDLADLAKDEAEGRFTLVGSLYRSNGLVDVAGYAISQFETMLEHARLINPFAEVAISYLEQVQENFITALSSGDLQAFDPETVQATDL